MIADRAQLADRRVCAVGEVGVAVAELLGEVEGQALGEKGGALGRRAVDAGEALDHLFRRPQHRLSVPSPLPLAAVERGAAADRDERVLEQRAPRRMGVDVAGGDRLDAETLGEIAEHRVAPRVAPLVRPLQLDEEPLAAERRGEPRGSRRIAEREPVARTAGQADEPLVQLHHRLERDGGRQGLPVLPPGTAGPGMGGGEDPAEVRVPPPALAEERHVARALDRHLGAGDRPDPGVLGGMRELERAVDAVVVGESERRVAELRRSRGELLGMRGAVEERVRRMAVELDVAAH